MQLGLLGGAQGGIIGANGLQIIQDENDENQDSDFSADEEDKIPENTTGNNTQTDNPENKIMDLIGLNQNIE